MKRKIPEWQAFLKQQKNKIEKRSWITVPIGDPNGKRIKINPTGYAKALKKMEVGTYGLCEECNYEIPLRRLEYVPSAILCNPCEDGLSGFPENYFVSH